MTMRKWMGGLAVLVAISSTGAMAMPAHYVVFTMDVEGHVRPDFYARVELARPLASTPANDASVNGSHADERIAYRAFRDGVDLGERSVTLPEVRGEFAHDPDRGDGRIEAYPVKATERSFVLRIPLDEADAVEFAGEKVAPQRFELAELAAKARTLPLASFTPAVQIVREPQSGSPANRVDLLVFSEGYTSAQQATFNADAQILHDSFFGLTPYHQYQSFVNWTTAFVASTQSGADHPPYQAGCTTAACCSDAEAQTDPLAGQFVNTAFDAKFCDYQIHRLLTINTAKVNASAAAYPDWDKIVIVVNDPVYGGSGGDISVTSTHAQAKQIVLHEYGHSFSGLADEYSSPYPGFPACSDLSGSGNCEANVTNQTAAAQVKWSSWFTPGNPIPTPGGTPGVGLFQGARYLTSGMYRPADTCLMKVLGVAFCPICAQEYVLSLYRGGFGVPAGGIDLIEPGSESPATAAPVAYDVGSTQTFQATLLQPTVGSLAVQWYLDGNPIGGANAPSYAFSTASGTPATHALELRVTDQSTLVKPAMAGSLLVHSRTWTIHVSSDTIFKNGFE